MTNALAPSDFAAKMAINANEHRRFFDAFDQNGFRTYKNQADVRVAGWIHGAINHQPHQAEY